MYSSGTGTYSKDNFEEKCYSELLVICIKFCQTLLQLQDSPNKSEMNKENTMWG